MFRSGRTSKWERNCFSNSLSRARDTPVDRHGFLTVGDGKIKNQQGEVVMLRGMSLFWSQLKPQFFNIEVIQTLRDDWNINVIRAPLGIHNRGYLDHPEHETQKIETVIDAAIELGIYVIVDWHAHLPEGEAASQFFLFIARKYGFCPNIIYETWNEPAGQFGWRKTIKPYHYMVASNIRDLGIRNLVAVGTQNWCRDVDIAANDPLAIDNIAYVLHFYAGSHGQTLRDKAELATRMGLPLLVTEWGTGNADGGGPLNYRETKRWWRFLEHHKIGYVNWSLSDQSESSAALRPESSVLGSWQETEISPSGQFVRAKLQSHRR